MREETCPRRNPPFKKGAHRRPARGLRCDGATPHSSSAGGWIDTTRGIDPDG